MRLACSECVRVWVVLSDEATIGSRVGRHRLVERVVALAMPRFRPANLSWSTSVDTLALAASSGPSVGIDLERPVMRRAATRYLAALASSCLSSREAIAFQRVGTAEWADWLLLRWTAKEAHLKRVGTGLCKAPSAIDIHWPRGLDGSGVALCATEHGGAQQDGPLSYLRAFTDAQAGFICSLACERPLSDSEVEFRCILGSELSASNL